MGWLTDCVVVASSFAIVIVNRYSGDVVPIGVLPILFVVLRVALGNRRIETRVRTEEPGRFAAEFYRSTGILGMLLGAFVMALSWHGTDFGPWFWELVTVAGLLFWLYGTLRLRQVNTPEPPRGSASGIEGRS